MIKIKAITHRKHLILLGACLILCSVINAQNLVPNGAFNKYTTCPNNSSMIDKALPWFGTSRFSLGGSSEFYHTCSSIYVSVPTNAFGQQQDHSQTNGGYAGFAFVQGPYYDSQNNPLYMKEFIEIGLIDTLQKNTNYCISFWVSNAEVSQVAIAGIQAYFTKDTLWIAPQGINHVVAPAQFTANQGIIYDTINWVKVSGSFIAKGGEKMMTIGNFQRAEDVLFQNFTVNNGCKCAYYYIDDVVVSPCKSLLDIDTILYPRISKMPIIPDVFTPGGDGINDVFEIQHLPPMAALTIHNRWGQVIYQTTNYKNNWAADNTPAGVYYYTLTYTLNAEQKRQQGTVKIIK